MKEQTFVDQSFSITGQSFRSAAEIITSPVQKFYESASREGGSIDILKRHFAKMLGLRISKSRGCFGRSLRYA